MSMLLDAVRRERQSQGLDIASHTLVLPRAQRNRVWYWVLPIACLGIGAAGSYGLKPILLKPEPVEYEAPQLILAKEAILPLPNWVPNIQAEISVANLDFYQQPPERPAPPPPKPVATKPKAPSTQNQSQQELDLLAALKQAVSDLGEQETFGINYAPTEPGQLYGNTPAPKPKPYQPTPDPADLFQDEIPKLGRLPWAFQKRVPDFEITAHIYATNPSERWLRGNGRQLQEGDEIAPGVKLAEILPDEVVLEMEGQKFRIPALGSI